MNWISVGDRLPDNNNNVLVCVNGDYVYGGCYIGHYNHRYNGWFIHYDKEHIPVGWHRVTHWLPIPKTPIVGEAQP